MLQHGILWHTTMIQRVHWTFHNESKDALWALHLGSLLGFACSSIWYRRPFARIRLCSLLQHSVMTQSRSAVYSRVTSPSEARIGSSSRETSSSATSWALSSGWNMTVAEEMMSDTPNQESASPASTVVAHEMLSPRFRSRHLLKDSPAETTVSPKSPSTWFFAGSCGKAWKSKEMRLSPNMS